MIMTVAASTPIETLAGLCVLQCVSIVASALKRAALSNSDCFAQQVRVIGRCTEVSDTFT